MSDIIQATGLTRTFQRGGNDVHALRGIDLTIEPGDFVALIGPSAPASQAFSTCSAGSTGRSGGTLQIGDVALHSADEAVADRPSPAAGRLYFSELQPAAAADRSRERGPAADALRSRSPDPPGASGSDAGAGRPRRAHRPLPDGALRRRAAAGGHRPGADPSADAGAGRRTDRQPRLTDRRGGDGSAADPEPRTGRDPDRGDPRPDCGRLRRPHCASERW